MIKSWNFTAVSALFFNPIAHRKAKIAYNFGHSECNRVKHVPGHNLSP